MGQCRSGGAGLGGDDQPGTDDDPYTSDHQAPAFGTTVKIADTANAMDDDPQFAQAMDLGWRTHHARSRHGRER